jgi:hypothetical protein
VREAVLTHDFFKNILVKDGEQEIGRVVAQNLDAGLVKAKSGDESLRHMAYVYEATISTDPDDQRVGLKEIDLVSNLLREGEIADIKLRAAWQIMVLHLGAERRSLSRLAGVGGAAVSSVRRGRGAAAVAGRGNVTKAEEAPTLGLGAVVG